MAQAFRTQNLRLLASILDANDNELIKSPSPVASAVNELTITNAATSASPSISATGDDANIGLNLISKGTGLIQINGKAISLANSFTTIGDFSLAFTTTASTSLTLPTSGLLATTSQIPTVNDNTLTLAGSGGIGVGTSPTFTANASADKTITITIADAALTIAKLENIATSSILGRTTGSSGPVEILGGSGVVSVIGTNAVSRATNLEGGIAGQIPYQSGANTTLFSAAGSLSQVLLSGAAGAPTWASQSTLSVGSATTAGSVTNALTISSPLTGTSYNGSTAISIGLQNASDTLPGGVSIGAQTFAGNKTFKDAVIISGDLTVNGTTITINSSTLSVDDKNIELGAVIAIASLSSTSNITATSNIVDVTSTSGLIVGQALTKTTGTGAFGTNPIIDSIVSATQFTVAPVHAITGSIVFSVSGATDITADTGGITLKGTTNKTFNWLNATSSWTSSENLDIVTGKTYKINNVAVLSATTLGSSVVNSSLTSVGTLVNLTVTNAITGSVSGSAASLSTSHTFWGQTFNGTQDVSGSLTSVGNITGSSAITITAGGSNQNVVLTPSGTGYTLLNGNVGIGTNNPAQKLHVVGNVLSSYNILTSVVKISSASDAASYISVDGYTAGLSYAGTYIGLASLVGFGVSANLYIGGGFPIIPTGWSGTISGIAYANATSLASSVLLQTSPDGSTWTTRSQTGAINGTETLTYSVSDSATPLYVRFTLQQSSGGSVSANNCNIQNIIITNLQSLPNKSSISNRFLVDGSGNVGIGTTTPTAVLNVKTSTTANREVFMGDSAAVNGVFRARLDDNSLSFISLENRDTAAAIDHGVGIRFNLGTNASNNAINAGGIYLGKEQTWNATASTQDSYLTFNTSLDGAAVEKVRIKSDGNVGIGQTNPGYKLDVGGIARVSDSLFVTTATTSDAKIEIGAGRTGNGNAYIDLIGDATYTDYGLRLIRSNGGANTTSAIAHRGTGAFYISTIDAASISLETTSITRMTIASGGNVGIGTVTPVAKLHINSTTAGETVLRSDGTNGTLFSVVDDLSDSLMSVNNSAGLPVLEVFADDRIVAGQYGQNDFVVVNNKVGLGANSPINKLSVIGSASIGDSTYNVSAPTNGLIVQGNVGIGNTAPAYKLDVAGSAYAYNYFSLLTAASYGPSDNSATIQVFGSTGSGGLTNTIKFVIGGNEKWRITNAGILQSSGAQTIKTDGGILTLATSTDGHIVLSPHGNGNVGIGTATPGVKLDVVGSAAISSTLTVTGITALNGAVNLSTAGTPIVTLGASTTYGVLTATGTNAASIYLNGSTRTGFEAKLQFGAAEHQWFNGSLSSQIMTLNTNGLGIGIASPAATLDVNGTTFLRGNLDAGRTASLNATAAVNGTGGGNREFVTFTGASATGFTGTDNADQGYGYFAATIVLGKSYEVSATMVVTNGATLNWITSTVLGSPVTPIQTIISSPVSNTIYRFTATANAAFVGLGFYWTSGTMTAVVSNFSIKEVSILVTSNSNVGIVTTSPTNTLDVNGSARVRSISASASQAIKFLTTDANGVLISRTNAEVRSDIGAGTGNGTVTSVTASTPLAATAGNAPVISLSGIVPIANGGTGAATAQLAINALAGAVTTAQFLRGDGTNVLMSAIQVADVPTLNQNTSGTAAGLSAVLAIASGGTGIGTTAANAFFVGPDGNTGAPSFRAMVSADIPTGIVSYSKIQNVNPNKVLGRITNSVGIVEELSGANIATIIGSSAITNASNVAITTDDATNSSHFLYFGATGTANNALKASTKIRYNPSTGAFSATTKSFRIPHPTKLEHDLVYGSLESPYHGVRLTGKGKTKGNRAEIFLPDYIKSLIDEETVNIQLTVIKCAKILYIENIIIDDNKFTVKYDKPWYEKCKDIEFYWDFTAERKDVPKLIVEEKI